MVTSTKDAEEMRCRIHNLDLTDKDDLKYYKEMRNKFVEENEKSIPHSYDDQGSSDIRYDSSKIKNGKITVGAGFNMDRGNSSRREWRDAFENSEAPEPDFDKVYNGKLDLTKEQMADLLDHSLSVRERELSRIYSNIWSDLKASERLGLEDLYYNSPPLIKGSTNFYKDLHKYYGFGKDGYIPTGDEKFLKDLLNEIKNKSNPKDKDGNINSGIQNRRNAQAAMLDSSKYPFYSMPYDKPFVEKKIKIIPGVTILPRIIDYYPARRPDVRYYIWRTKNDNKVRLAHQTLADKVYIVGQTPKYHDNVIEPGNKNIRCRCFYTRLPDFIEVIKTPETKAAELEILYENYMRQCGIYF